MNCKKVTLMFLLIVILFPSFLSFSSVCSAQSFDLIKVDEYNINVGYTINVEGNYAYIADNNGISIFDISDPSNVVIEQTIPLSSACVSAHLVDGLIYAACGTDGFYIINVTDISNSEILGHDDVFATGIFVQGDLAFVSDFFSGLIIFDISDKSNPVEESLYFQSGNVWATVAKGEIAYIANPSLGIEVLNVTEPSNPVKIATLSSASGATHLSINENRLYVGMHGSGLNIFDISTLSTPVLLGSYDDSDDGEELGLRGNDTYLAVADNFGIELFDISNLPSVSKIAEYRDNIGAAHDVEMVDNHIYAVDGRTGFVILEITTQPVPTTEANLSMYTIISLLLVLSLMNVINQRKRKK